jgi:hypothetical protein
MPKTVAENILISTDKGKDYFGTRKHILRELGKLPKRRENFLTLTRNLKQGSIQIFWLHDENRFHIENVVSKEKVYSAKVGNREQMENFINAFMDLKGWRKMLDWEKMDFEPDL